MNQAVEKMTDADIQAEVLSICKAAKDASVALASSSDEQRNTALNEAAKALRANKAEIQAENNKDLEAAKANGLSGAMLDRLELNDGRIEAMAVGLESIAKLDDPLGKTLAEWSRDTNGLHIKRVSMPLGVIGVIYESRPNVTADAGALCLKSGNAAILRGGSESFFSSTAILKCLQSGLRAAGLSENAIQSIPTKDRAAVGYLLNAAEYVDVIVPRGGKGLIKRIMEDSKVPTFQHLEGLCHSYIHEGADVEKAVKLVANAKMRRTGICGATETVVVDKAIANEVLPELTKQLVSLGCEVRGDVAAQHIDGQIIAATDEDWVTEYLDAIVSVKVVDGLEEGIKFVQDHSSSHTDCIITEDAAAAEKFLNEVGSSIVMHNTSTQFADGGEFGMGAEIGIATGKMHARGPVGIEQLTTFKYRVVSDGSVRPS